MAEEGEESSGVGARHSPAVLSRANSPPGTDIFPIRGFSPFA